MSTQKKCAETYFYGYVQTKTTIAENVGLSLPKILKKLPKLELMLPQISICENLGLSFC